MQVPAARELEMLCSTESWLHTRKVVAAARARPIAELHSTQAATTTGFAPTYLYHPGKFAAGLGIGELNGDW